MIRNNLSVLLSERGMKNTTLSIKTGISKNTISSISQNDVKMIQLETINKICQVLNIEPGELFSFYPYDFEFTFSFDSFNLTTRFNEFYELSKLIYQDADIEGDLFVTLKKAETTIEVFELGLTFMSDYSDVLFDVIDVMFFFNDESELKFSSLWKSIPINFRSDIIYSIKKEFRASMRTEIEKVLPEAVETSLQIDQLEEFLDEIVKNFSLKIDLNSFEQELPF